jgi:hypothetical protein
MKSIAFVALMGLSLFTATTAFADADDMKWVARCLSDNADAKVDVSIVTKYCTCMNNKMSSNETQSISTWEKSHPDEMKACDKEAGWN